MKTQDVTIIQLGDSISTNNNYASAVNDAAYRPPRMEEHYIPYYIEELLRWRGQHYRRSDAMTEQGGSSPMFTETGSGENKYYDSAWDWQVSSLETNYYRLWTRVLTGTNCSVSFNIPKNTKQAAFIYRTDYLCASQTNVSISGGNGICKIKLSSGNVEANGYSFSMKEEDKIINNSNGNLRKSQGQKRLIFRFDDISQDRTITITNVGEGRLNYWGVEWSPYEFMLRYINVSRGAHNISKLEAFEEWDVDDFKPDAILFQCCIINEGAVSQNPASGNTPSAFAQRFYNYINKLKSKDYSPEIIPYVLYIGVQANIVNQTTGEYQCAVLNSEYVDTYKYIGTLDKSIRELLGYFLNFFNDYDNIAHRKAKIEGTNNIWISAINQSGQRGDTFTADTVHLNDYGSLIGYRLLKPYLS